MCVCVYCMCVTSGTCVSAYVCECCVHVCVCLCVCVHVCVQVVGFGDSMSICVCLGWSFVYVVVRAFLLWYVCVLCARVCVCVCCIHMWVPEEGFVPWSWSCRQCELADPSAWSQTQIKDILNSCTISPASRVSLCLISASNSKHLGYTMPH